MFKVEGTTITLSRGDTGAVRIEAETDYTFTSDDRALFTIKDSAGKVVRDKAYPIDENNGFNVYFFNEDTDKKELGTFTWDVRFVIHPYYDSAGKIVDGDQVITPNNPMQINLINVVGEI